MVANDFRVECIGKEHAAHLRSVIRKYYPVTKDWVGSKYIGITLNWNYVKRQVHLSIPGYVNRFTAKSVLERFQRGEIFVNIIRNLLLSNGEIAAK